LVVAQDHDADLGMGFAELRRDLDAFAVAIRRHPDFA
jgi:hypothetical protein